MKDSTSLVRATLLHGAAFMVFGLLYGAAIGAAPYPRLALGAHVQFTTAGVMFLVAGLVIAYASLGRSAISRALLLAGPWVTWGMALSEAANAWWGASKTLPLAAHEAGATGGAPWQEGIVLAAHVVGAIGMLAYWIVILVELCKWRTVSQQREA